MFAGHFAVAAAAKAKSPEVPLWALMLGTQLAELVFIPFFVSGVETIVPVAGNRYGGYLIHAEYTHSLVGGLVLALLAGLWAGRLWGRRGGLTMGWVVFSHWLLDLVVHRPDMPVLPGNLGGFPLLGLGLWNTPAASIALEATLLVVGFILYLRSLPAGAERKGWRVAAGGAMGALLVLALIQDVLGIA